MTPVKNVVAFATEVLGINLSPVQADALRGIEAHRDNVLACGRRGGKSLVVSIWGTFDACVRDLSQYLRPGEVRYVVLVAAGLSQARALFRTVRAFFELPMLRDLVVSETNDELSLSTGVILRVTPCNSRTARGLAISTIIFEEIASYVDSEGYQSGDAVYAALSPSVAQFGQDGRVISVSTPQGQRGVFWRLYQQADRREDAYALNVPTWEMNPAITEKSLAPEKEANAWLYDQEYAASWLAGGESFIPLHTLITATGIPEHEHGRRVLAIDPAFSQDQFGLAIACRPKGNPSWLYVEHVRALRRPGFEASMDEVAATANAHGVNDVVTDQMSHAAILSALRKRDLRPRMVPWTGRSNTGRSKHHRYGEFKALLSQGALRLVDDAALRSELSNFSVSPSSSPPGFAVESRGPDDRADAAVMSVTECRRSGRIGLYT